MMFVLTSRNYNLERVGVITGKERINIYRVETMQELKHAKAGVVLWEIWDIFEYIDNLRSK